jgi:hypothetical protein
VKPWDLHPETLVVQFGQEYLGEVVGKGRSVVFAVEGTGATKFNLGTIEVSASGVEGRQGVFEHVLGGQPVVALRGGRDAREGVVAGLHRSLLG